MLEMADSGPDAQQNLMPKLADILTGNRIILLKEQAGTRAVAIWVGPYEAANILLGLERRSLPRALTYDFTKALLDLGQITLERAVVQRLHENTYYGNLIVKVGEATSEIDCRPSDAINLALRLEAPIFAAAEVMEQIAFTPAADGTYTLAASTAAHVRTISEPEEREKEIARTQGKIWSTTLYAPSATPTTAADRSPPQS
jgi:bifunctional DNase/RNase